MQIKNRIATLACVACLAACSSKPNVEIDEALAAITQENLQATTSYLADDARNGRRAGSPGHEDAARYVAEKFEEFGLQPGGDDGYYQQVSLVSAAIDAEGSGVILHTDSGEQELEWFDDAVVYPDAHREQSRVRAEVVFVGFGIHAPELGYSDYADIDVQGKIVAMFRGGPATFSPAELSYYSSIRAKEAELVSRGAVAQILIWSSEKKENQTWEEYYAGYPNEPITSWQTESAGASKYHSLRIELAGVNRTAAEKLFADSPLTLDDALEAANNSLPMSTALGIEATLFQKSRQTRFTSPNVVGILPGSDSQLKNEFVVFSAHLDHVGTKESDEGDTIYNGFYDNAMGIAVMLESARALSNLTEAPLRSTVFLATTAEEAHWLGADYFVNNPASPDMSIVANINVDLPMFLFPMNTITTWGAERTTFDAAAAAEVALEGFESRPYPYPGEEGDINRSDHYPFAIQGIPFIWMMEGTGSSDTTVDGLALINAFYEEHYHNVSDDLSRVVHWDSARRFARACARITHRIAMDDDVPIWNDGDFFGATFGGK
jgi:hypothetical protein